MSRMVLVGVSLIVAVSVFTGSVLLIGYVAAAVSLLTVVTLLIRKAIRGEAMSLESPIPRGVEPEEREAA